MNKILFSSIRDNWRTPKSLYDLLNEEFRFTIDLCADDSNKLCDQYYSVFNNMLFADLDPNEMYYCNPPYGKQLYQIIEKIYNSNINCVLLLPSRTDTKWFHDFILKAEEIRFVKGRLRFDDHKSPAPFPSMIVVFKRGIENEK